MNRSKIHLLDMPDELLLIILKKLKNIDVLYSLLDVDNGRLNILAQEQTFSNTLQFVSIQDIHLIDRFCIDILPKIYQNVKCFIFDSDFMERILLNINYPNLTDLTILHFRQECASHYFTNESSLASIFQEQITNLTLFNNDQYTREQSLGNYTINIYANILNFFKNLKHLCINERSHMSYPPLSLCNLSPTTFFSPILTHLHINVKTLTDCFYLLDGRLKQLTTLSVNVYAVDKYLPIVHNIDNLSNLKCFSLKSYIRFKQYDKVVLLLRCMSHLEKLTLYLPVQGRNEVIDGTDVQNDILHYMPKLHSFTFYICTYLFWNGIPWKLSHEHIQQSLRKIKENHVASMVNYVHWNIAYGSIFSLPFAFERLPQLGNTFPNVVFSHVTHLTIQDIEPFEHEFFIRITRLFPLLNSLTIFNRTPSRFYEPDAFLCDKSQSYSIIEYPRLTSLQLICAHRNYIEQFLDERKAFVPCLMELEVDDIALKIVTMYFTRTNTRRNCARIKRLSSLNPMKHSRELFDYFPSLDI